MRFKVTLKSAQVPLFLFDLNAKTIGDAQEICKFAVPIGSNTPSLTNLASYCGVSGTFLGRKFLGITSLLIYILT